MGIAITAQWRVIAFLIVAVTAFVTTLLMAGLVAAAPLAVTAVAGVLLRSKGPGRPRPQIEIRPLARVQLWAATEAARSMAELLGNDPDEWAPAPPAGRSSLVVGGRRELDIEALLEDAVRNARSQAPGASFLVANLGWTREWAEPTAADHERFAREVDEYAEQMRAWLAELEGFLTDRARILIAELVQTNGSSVDARESRIVVRFPAGFEPVRDYPEAPDRPAQPSFPLRRSAFSLAMSRHEPFRPSLGRHDFALAVERVAQVSPWEPDYRRVDGHLEVDYPRQTVRHGERDVSGEPFVLRCPETGHHTVVWEVHGANLERCERGELELTTVMGTEGDPIRSLADLDEVLAQLDPDEGSEPD